MKEEIQPYYKKQAEFYIDALFDKGYFGNVSRKDMRDVEDLLAFLFQSQCESAVKSALLLHRINAKEEKEAE